MCFKSDSYSAHLRTSVERPQDRQIYKHVISKIEFPKKLQTKCLNITLPRVVQKNDLFQPYHLTIGKNDPDAFEMLETLIINTNDHGQDANVMIDIDLDPVFPTLKTLATDQLHLFHCIACSWGITTRGGRDGNSIACNQLESLSLKLVVDTRRNVVNACTHLSKLKQVCLMNGKTHTESPHMWGCVENLPLHQLDYLIVEMPNSSEWNVINTFYVSQPQFSNFLEVPCVSLICSSANVFQELELLNKNKKPECSKIEAMYIQLTESEYAKYEKKEDGFNLRSPLWFKVHVSTTFACKWYDQLQYLEQHHQITKSASLDVEK